MRQIGRRSLLAGVVGAGGMALAEPDSPQESRKAPRKLADPAELDRAAAAPVLKVDGLKSPVIIDSMRLLKKGNDYLVHVRSKDGAEGVSITNPPRAQYLDHVERSQSTCCDLAFRGHGNDWAEWARTWRHAGQRPYRAALAR